MWIGCTITAIGFITKGALQLSTSAFVKRRVGNFVQGTFNCSSSFDAVRHISIANFRILLSTMADSQQATGSGEAKDEPIKELTAKQLKKQAQKDAKKAKFEKKMEGIKQQPAEVHHNYYIIYVLSFFIDHRKRTKKPKRKLTKRLSLMIYPFQKEKRKVS